VSAPKDNFQGGISRFGRVSLAVSHFFTITYFFLFSTMGTFKATKQLYLCIGHVLVSKFSFSGDTQDPPGQGPVQPAVGDPASAGGLD